MYRELAQPITPLRDSVAITFDRGRGPEETVEFFFPHINPTFSSPLVNARNLEISGGAPWQWLISRVVNSLKPVGFVDGADEAEMKKAAKTALAAACGAQFLPHHFPEDEWNEGRDHFFVSAAVPGVINEMFDLDSLLADYHAYLTEAPREAIEDIEREIGRISRRSPCDFLDFAKVEVSWVGSRRRPGELARCGLLLGYPVETTAALICGDLGLRGCGSSGY